ncbi:UNVERIFIED_ORG: hypothetical protein M2187_004799 [Bradyrhizobium japonicum]
MMRARTSVPHAGTESNCARIPTANVGRASARLWIDQRKPLMGLNSRGRHIRQPQMLQQFVNRWGCTNG